MDLGRVVTMVEQQVNGLPLVCDRGVTHHGVLADVGFGDSVSEFLKAEIRPDFTHRERVVALVPQ